MTSSARVSSSTVDPNTANDTGTTTTTVNTSCTTTQAGNVAGSVIVPSGQFLCLIGGSVGGTVIVKPGGALSASNATIGSISSDGAAFVTVCGSTVNGPVTIKNTAGMVRVGDDDAGCAGNQLGAALLVSGNQGGVEIYGNTVGGSVGLSHNHGASPLTGDAAPEVEGNHVTGALACSGDSPPAVDDGSPNAATGSKTGECVGL